MTFFEKQLSDCEAKFTLRNERYGDAWKEMPIQELFDKLEEEITELSEAREPTPIMEELVDVVNVCLMLMVRLDDYKKSQGTSSNIPSETPEV